MKGGSNRSRPQRQKARKRGPFDGRYGARTSVPRHFANHFAQSAEPPANHAGEPNLAHFDGLSPAHGISVVRDWDLIAEAVLVARAQDTNPRTLAKYELHLGHFADYLASARRRASSPSPIAARM
jgi:hypothetical protein